MTFEQAALQLAELVRKAVDSPHSHLRHTERAVFRRALHAFDCARERKTGIERVFNDDEEDLPGAKSASSTYPACRFCTRQYRPRKKGQKFCSTDCRKAAFHARRRASPAPEDSRPAAPPVLGQAKWMTFLDDDS